MDKMKSKRNVGEGILGVTVFGDFFPITVGNPWVTMATTALDDDWYYTEFWIDEKEMKQSALFGGSVSSNQN